MEYSLGLTVMNLVKRLKVLILILMEYSLGQINYLQTLTMGSLNPYSNGILTWIL